MPNMPNTPHPPNSPMLPIFPREHYRLTIIHPQPFHQDRLQTMLDQQIMHSKPFTLESFFFHQASQPPPSIRYSWLPKPQQKQRWIQDIPWNRCVDFNKQPPVDISFSILMPKIFETWALRNSSTNMRRSGFSTVDFWFHPMWLLPPFHASSGSDTNCWNHCAPVWTWGDLWRSLL